jgi:hypothetical protein
MTTAKARWAAQFVKDLAALRFENVFNPYADHCGFHDAARGASIRRRNLQAIVEATLSGRVESLWVARDLGYRGGRRTGLALTDEVHLRACATLLRSEPLLQATRGPLVAERTAAVVWRTLIAIGRPVMLWNVFPLHPHRPGDPMSNRRHSRSERRACQPFLLRLIEVLSPTTVVAIGRDAEVALGELNVAATSIRHPSYGGQPEFLNGLENLYGISLKARSARSSPAAVR